MTPSVFEFSGLISLAGKAGELEAGAHTRPPYCSTLAVSDANYTLYTPKHPINNPLMHPLSHSKRLR
jgi:hypothetical protein